jgi:hypothetical protein
MNTILNEIKPFGDIVIEVNGRLGNRVYYTRNGRQCCRRHVTPANPRTELQQGGRTRLASLVKRWKGLDPGTRERWNRRARHLNMSGYNLFISRGMKRKAQTLRYSAGTRRYQGRRRIVLPAGRTGQILAPLSGAFCVEEINSMSHGGSVKAY